MAHSTNVIGAALTTLFAELPFSYFLDGGFMCPLSGADRLAPALSIKQIHMTTTPAQRLRALRREQGFELADTARCLGVHESKVRRLETGAQEPALSDICALLATYRTSFEALFDPEVELAKAEVYARIANFRPERRDGPHDKRLDGYLRLKKYLNQLHGSDC